jgi:hypothetical protein
MKTPQQILDRIDGQIESLEFALKSGGEKTDLSLKREGALAALLELKRFITDAKWGPDNGRG